MRLSEEEKAMRTFERVSLTPAGHEVASALEPRDPGWSAADDDRYQRGRRRAHLMAALVERAARRTPR